MTDLARHISRAREAGRAPAGEAGRASDSGSREGLAMMIARLEDAVERAARIRLSKHKIPDWSASYFDTHMGVVEYALEDAITFLKRDDPS